MTKKGNYYVILIIVTIILGIINLLLILGDLYIGRGNEVTAANLGSIFGFSLAIFLLYKIVKFILSRNKSINIKLSKREIFLASLSVALLIYFLLGLASGSVTEDFNEFKKGFQKGYQRTIDF